MSAPLSTEFCNDPTLTGSFARCRPFVLSSPGPMPPCLQRSLVGARIREEQSSYLRGSCVSNIAPSKPGRLPQGGLTFGGGTEQVFTVKLVAGPWVCQPSNTYLYTVYISTCSCSN